MIDSRMLRAFEEKAGFPLGPNLLLLAMVGSHSHGTYVPPLDPDAIDDVDYMGLIIPPVDYRVGLRTFEHCVFQIDELDVVTYDLIKAVGLLLKSNPNILGLLWLRPQEYEMVTALGQVLIDHRGIFSSLRAYEAFTGYAFAQLQKMTRFDQEAMDDYETTTETLRAAGFDIPQLIDRNGPDFDQWVKQQGFEIGQIIPMRHLRSLHKKHFSGYMGEKRKGLVRKFGFDAKNAAHLIRLLRMCNEFLQTGELNVYRTHDAALLREIKSGAWSLEAVQIEADRLFAEAQELYLVSPLPPEPDWDAAHNLVMQLHHDWYRGGD